MIAGVCGLTVTENTARKNKVAFGLRAFVTKPSENDLKEVGAIIEAVLSSIFVSGEALNAHIPI